jgi:hypothetical protein
LYVTSAQVVSPIALTIHFSYNKLTKPSYNKLTKPM